MYFAVREVIEKGVKKAAGCLADATNASNIVGNGKLKRES
jgi:hypothetical protein